MASAATPFSFLRWLELARFARAARRTGAWRALLGGTLALLGGPPAVLAQSGGAEALVNTFNDPVRQVTHGLPTCPVPPLPSYTREEFEAQAHERSQRGVSCWLAGRCRLSNAYLYDAEIVPRVDIALNQSDRFSASSVWVLGQRRRVMLRGCVPSAEMGREIEALVRGIDDVEDVQNELRTLAPAPVRPASAVDTPGSRIPVGRPRPVPNDSGGAGPSR